MDIKINIEPWITVVIGLLYLIFGFIGFVSNFTTFLMICFKRVYRLSAYTIMANIALADSVIMLLIGGGCGFYILYLDRKNIGLNKPSNSSMQATNEIYLLSYNLNKLNTIICFLLISAWISGILSYAILGMNRCVAIRYYGTKAKFFNRVSIAIISSILAWLIGTITAYFGTFPEPIIGLRSELWSITFKENVNNKRSKLYFYIIAFLNIISLSIQWICSILVLLRIRVVKEKINKNKLNQSSANRFKKQARLTFQFFYPSLLCTISSILFLSKPFLFGIFSNWHLIILHLIWIFNHLCNPFIYSYFNERMRFTYREIYHCSYIQYLVQKRRRFSTMGWTRRSHRYIGKSARNSVKSCRSTRDGNFVRNSLQMQSRDFEQLCEFMMRVNPLYDSSEGWQECSDEEESFNKRPIIKCTKKKKNKNDICKKEDQKELSNTGIESRSVVLHLGRDTVEQWVRFAKKASI
uniref:G_PROTEIN_RECEP_F1_2 domain-containing protein n=1 Tax=Strongyloides papillosus TaxID=174720 RepID=A0A0N5BZ58_STREA